MKFNYNVIFLFNFAGAAIGIFLTFVVLGKKRRSIAPKIFLALLVFSLSVMTLASQVQGMEPRSFFFPLLTKCGAIWYLIGPLIFFYTKSLICSGFVFRKEYILHFIPFFAIGIFAFVYYVLRIGVFVDNFYENQGFLIEKVTQVIRNGHLLSYLIVGVFILRQHKKDVVNIFSSLEKYRLDWLRFLIYILSTLLILNLCWTMIYKYLPVFFTKFQIIFQISDTVIILCIGYKGLVQPEIFSSGDDINNHKYKDSTLTKEQAEEFLEKIKDHMDNNKSFRESDLTLGMLSQQLSISPRHLSQVINEQLHQNFFEFVNRYRVEEAKKQLIDENNKKYTILAIAYEVGFNSKSTFNTVFRKYTNMTPSQYKKHHI